ncbi:helix-turn-helix transcriptional regulator [Olsenella sp. DSM 107455]|uniref:Helix-turn-helix transcriptional regulator n=1 Tax=Thermophilibacter gallinarum TaxID=2779357 RepID=A0ABR9QTB0_9ACTN|nr:type II toxin-antitoxin system Y4mF family antitoxin [Thermophilibacter gallinarum]MBE5024305.1 helix-turn-helix transcriptional regulator [Thermophilibacter gallinarum]
MIQVGSVGDLAALIRSERRRQGITQADLAGLSGVGVTFLSQLENGKESAELGKALNVLTMLGIDLVAEPRS